MTAPTGYNLVFEDNFDSDLSNWNKLDFTVENWLTCKSALDSYIENGNYVAKMENTVCTGDSTHNARNGGIITKQSWLYGYFEVRAKVAAGIGINSAFWLMRTDWSWPPEIDVYETSGNNSIPNTIYMTIHYDTDNKTEQASYTGPDYSLDYHIFGMEWTASTINFYIDNILRSTMTTQASMKVPMGVILEVGPGWSGRPVSGTLPKYHYVDYLQVYQQGVVPPPTTYKCSGAPNYACIAVTDGSGKYTTLAACKAACKVPIPTTTYKCSGTPNYTCTAVTDGSGKYATLADCKAACRRHHHH